MQKLILLILTFILLQAFVSANPNRELINKAGNSKDFPNDQQLTIFDSTYVDVMETGLSNIFTHRLQKVLTAKGALDLSYVKYDYDPLSAAAEIKRVIIYRANGTQEEIDVKKVQDYPAPARAIYWGAREIILGLGRLEPEDAVEVWLYKKGFTYALLQADDDDKFIPPMRGHFYDIVPFYSDFPVLSKVYLLSLPASKQLQFEFYNGEVTASQTIKQGKTQYTFSKKNIFPIKAESNMVDKSDVAPKLLMSTNPDWKTKSVWFFGVNENFGSFESDPSIKAKVNEILKSAKSEEDSISLLTHWCADEIRYSGISMGKGEGFTLHKGDMTFTDRCGVCKDKAGMLITMLRAAGFKSYPAMTMAGSRIDYIPADQFNHCVTVVMRRNGKYQLLDPTWVPFLRELWSSAEQQQNYLMGVPEGADLGLTDVSSPENHYFHISGNSEISKTGALSGSFILTAEGQSDASVRRFFTGTYKVQWKMYMERELLKVAPRAQLVSVDYGDPYDYQKGPIRIEFHYVIPDYAIVTENEIIFSPLVINNLFKGSQGQLSLNTSLKERKFPFRDRCSRSVLLTETVKLPYNCALAVKPNMEFVNGNAVEYNVNVVVNGSSLIVTEVASYYQRIYEASDWPDFRKAALAQTKLAEEPIILTIKK